MAMIDLSGQDLGLWHVLGPAGKDSNGRMLWRCRCSCGIERVVSSSNLRGGKSTSCGHDKGVSRRVDLTGRRFGHLVALSREGYRGGQSLWLCRCDCGKTTTVSMSNLKSGHTTSCGCALQAVQQDPAARVAAQDLSPLTRPGEQHIAARSFRLQYGGQIYDVHNLRNFVRTNTDLFGINGGRAEIDTVCKALYAAGQRGYTWHGWTVTRR